MYELTYIINPNLSETEVATQTDKVRGFINGIGGEIKEEKLGEKRKLAYPIKKQNFGFYVTVQFNLEPDKIAELEKQIRMEQLILRHLLVAKEEAQPTAKPIPFIKPIITPKIATEQKPEKVKIEEIDKKLEELLEE